MFQRIMIVTSALVAVLTAAAQPTIAIVELDTGSGLTFIGSKVTRLLVENATTMKLKIIEPEEVRTKLDTKMYEQLKKCGGRPACVSQFSTKLGVTRVVVGSMNRDDKSYLLRLWMVDTDKLEIVNDVDRSILIAARRLDKDLEQAVPAFLRGEKEAKGTLKVTSNVKEAEVSVNGELVGFAPVELALKPGKHDLKVERKRYHVVTRLVTVEANETTNEEVKLFLLPGERGDDDPLPKLTKVADSNAPEQPTPSGSLGWYTWAAAGVTVGALVVGVVLGFSARSGEQALLSGYDAATDRYSGTRAQALAVREQALGANIAWVVTGVAGAATVALAIYDLLFAPKSAVKIAPAPTSGGATLMIGGQW